MKLSREDFVAWGAKGARKAKRVTSKKQRLAAARKAAAARWGKADGPGGGSGA